jgi:hypothetical protein
MSFSRSPTERGPARGTLVRYQAARCVLGEARGQQIVARSVQATRGAVHSVGLRQSAAASEPQRRAAWAATMIRSGRGFADCRRPAQPSTPH